MALINTIKYELKLPSAMEYKLARKAAKTYWVKVFATLREKIGLGVFANYPPGGGCAIADSSNAAG